MRTQIKIAMDKIIVFIASLIPVIYLSYLALTSRLGANPIQGIIHFTGDWALNFILISLAMTPLRRLTKKGIFIKYRRMLGLYAFFYTCLHFATYLVLDQYFDWQTIIEDIVKRPYITVGFAGFVLLIPLTLTSTRRMMQRLGPYWKRLHRLAYLVGFLGIVHYLWLVKSDLKEPLIYAAIFTLLMLLRLPIRQWPTSPLTTIFNGDRVKRFRDNEILN